MPVIPSPRLGSRPGQQRPLEFAFALAVAAALLASRPGAQRTRPQLGGVEVRCNGADCSGGSGVRPFLYRVDPNGKMLAHFEVGVHDADLSHYTDFVLPAGWTVSIVRSARPHRVTPSPHGQPSSAQGGCEHALRFAATAPEQALSVPFELGYAYSLQHVHHDATWKTNGDGTAWGFPAGAGSGSVHTPVPHLNVLLIVLDDVGTDKLRPFDQPEHVGPPDAHPFARTPHLDALAASGLRFRSFYANPVCSTTRACIQTGRYAFRHGIGHLATGFPMRGCEVTLAELLRDGFAGFPGDVTYASGAFGKWHLAPGNPAHAVENGYERFYGSVANLDDHYAWLKTEHDAFGALVQFTETHWSADVVRRDAVTWINATTRPFLAYVAFHPPHDPIQVPFPYESALTLEGEDLLSSETEAELYADASPEALYRAMLEMVDHEIHYLLRDVDTQKLADTLVLVVSDNGTPGEHIVAPHDPAHGKMTVHQLGVRVPLIVAGPLVEPGACDAPVGAVDLWRTIAAVAGADVDSALSADTSCEPLVDGRSLFSLLQTPAESAPGALAFTQLFLPNGYDVACLCRHDRAITDGRYKYLRKQAWKPDDAPGGGLCDGHLCDPPAYTEELYDLVEDPEEQTPLVVHENELREIFERLKRAMLLLSGDGE